MKKNVLFLTFSRGISGAEIVILNLMQSLQKTQFTPYVFCHESNTPLIQRLEGLGIVYFTTAQFPALRRVGQTGVNFPKLSAYVGSLIRIYFELTSLLRRYKIDLVYANAYPDCLYGIGPSLMVRVPLVWHVHNIRKIHRKNRLIYKTAGRFSQRIITVSEASRKNLLRSGINPARLLTIYNGIDVDRFKPEKIKKDLRAELDWEPDHKIVGLFGQPIPEKGHTFFIQAASEVVKSFPDVKFLIVGHLFDTEYQRKLFALVEGLKLQNSIIFTGWRPDIPKVMSAIDVLAHTRVTPEPGALVLLEAMALGKPIVASRTGGTPEIVQDGVTGILVPPADAHALAKGILHLLEKPEKARQMGLNGRQRAENLFSLDRQLKNIHKLLSGILY